jgi:serine/threonine protein kinase
MQLFPRSDPQLIDLIEKIVKYAPEKRLTAEQALCHPYFNEIRE